MFKLRRRCLTCSLKTGIWKASVRSWHLCFWIYHELGPVHVGTEKQGRREREKEVNRWGHLLPAAWNPSQVVLQSCSHFLGPKSWNNSLCLQTSRFFFFLEISYLYYYYCQLFRIPCSSLKEFLCSCQLICLYSVYLALSYTWPMTTSLMKLPSWNSVLPHWLLMLPFIR